RIYVQQPPISASGYSSQAFAPHFPHTVRLQETKTCTDCHLSQDNDNNAIMAQLLLQGTNFVNFVGLHAWVGEEQGFEAVRITEWDEPQAVFGSYLHRYAYPEYWDIHTNEHGRELREFVRGDTFDEELSGETRALEEIQNVTQRTNGATRCLQLRGEYMFVAEGSGGFQVYDVASIGNKGFSERIITAPFSPLGHDTRVDTTNATCMALPTNQNIAPTRQETMAGTIMTAPDGTQQSLLDINREQRFHPIYNYAFITDSVEGLVVVNVNTMADGEFRNNFLRREEFANGGDAWNENGVLDGANHITLGGHYAFIAADAGMVVIDLDDPHNPRHVATIPLTDARSSALQFRYLWVTTAEGVQLIDVTNFEAPRLLPNATFPLADARRLYIARTYAYVAAGADGLVILNVTNPERPVRLPPIPWLNGETPDTQDVIVGTTNASLFAYVADGRNGMKVFQLTSPDSQPNFYGFSPEPRPELIAWMRTSSRALALSKGLDRDRAVDETGGQMAVFGRRGSRPFNRQEMERLFLNSRGEPYRVTDQVNMDFWVERGWAAR
uniref:LVIVD repeat-containing protein n=1 Tax=uncultured Parasphingopyxis sp. TaxID=1547918 RepID=UPI00345C2AC1